MKKDYSINYKNFDDLKKCEKKCIEKIYYL